MKWLKRISSCDFDITNTSTGSLVLQEALDCFCFCVAKANRRLPVSVAMAAKLNFVKTTVCCSYVAIKRTYTVCM